VAVDHKSLEELRTLFADYLARAKACVVNADNGEATALAPGGALTYGLVSGVLHATAIIERPDGVGFVVDGVAVSLAVPGRHNVSNALAAIGAATQVGVTIVEAAASLAGFTGLKRRMETVGAVNDVTVIDDFGHNPDKIAATLSALHAFPGRLVVFFQPHGFGPLKQMGRELADSFIANLKPGDRLIVCDPVYFGGTVDKTVGAGALVAMIGAQAEHVPQRVDCADRLIALAQPGDRIVVMGARDDTLSLFAQSLLERLG
jgi:UDP-N-acetylmuramate--alanine ligase